MKNLLQIPFKQNNNGNLVIKKPTKALLVSKTSQTNFQKYSLATINRIFDKTKMVLINPNSAHNDQICLMVNKVHLREFIPVFLAHDCTMDDYKTISFGVYEASNHNGNTKYLFAYLSNETDIIDIEDELEKKDIMGNSVLIYLTDLFAECAGCNHSIVYTINVERAQNHIKKLEKKEQK